MLAPRLIKLIEDHAEELTRGAIRDVRSNPRTPAYHQIPEDEMHRRLYDVYHHLGRWVGEKSDERIETSYAELGRRRHAEGTPLSEVVYALILSKQHLREYIRASGHVGTAVELMQEEELNLLLGHFYDKAIYYTIRGYEQASRRS